MGGGKTKRHGSEKPKLGAGHDKRGIDHDKDVIGNDKQVIGHDKHGLGYDKHVIGNDKQKIGHIKNRIEKHKLLAEHEEESVTTTSDNRPSPDNFVDFLPWACKQLMFEYDILIHEDKQKPLIKQDDKAGKSKLNVLLIDSKSRSTNKDLSLKSSVTHSTNIEFVGSKGVAERLRNMVYITVVYDVNNRIVEIKFPHNNLEIPCNLIKLIGLIIQFQPHMHSFTMGSGANIHTIKQLSQFIPATNITDVCLDGMVLEGANYHVLLDCDQLKCLSLRRCQIYDNVVELLTSKLKFKMSQTLPQRGLAALNLSSNLITDRGAQFLAQVLRSNRSLCYLNLSGNQITDEGAGSILNVLTSFEMTLDEIYLSRRDLMTYVITKKDLVKKCMFELQSQADKPSDKMSKMRPNRTPRSRKSDAVKADEMADKLMDAFDSHPFAKENTLELDGRMHCKGNNRLAYLGLNYNNLSVQFLKQLHNVLVMQASDRWKTKGLTKVSIEGNPFQSPCAELKLIDFLMQASVARKSNYYKQAHHKKS